MKLPECIKYFCIGFFSLLVLSCHKESEDSPVVSHLVDYSLVSVYSQATIAGVLTAAAVEYPGMTEIVEKISYGVQVYRISYTTYYRDSLVTASGLVCLPAAKKSFPVISFQNGTNTSHDAAPSANPDNGSYLMMEYMASNGYIILMTDYIGFGESSDLLHPYYHRVSTNNAVIDMLRALDEFTAIQDIQAQNNDSIYLMGYSQGGWATLSTLEEIEHGDALTADVIAASCGAGAYDLTSMSTYVLALETFPGPLYLPYFIHSQQLYGNIPQPLSTFFKEPYATSIPVLFSGEYSNNEVNAGLTDTVADFVSTAMLTSFLTGTEFNELRTALTDNSLSGWNTAALLNIYHGTNDMNVPPQQSEDLFTSFVNSGANADQVKYYPMQGLTHETGLMPWGIMTINWFNSLNK